MLHPCCVLTWQRELVPFSFLIRALISAVEPHTTSSKPNYFPKAAFPNTITLELGLQNINFGEYTVQFTAPTKSATLFSSEIINVHSRRVFFIVQNYCDCTENFVFLRYYECLEVQRLNSAAPGYYFLCFICLWCCYLGTHMNRLFFNGQKKPNSDFWMSS